MTLHRLVYYSSNRLKTTPLDFRAEVENILEASRRNNQLVGTTGALMFSNGFFGQVLEGSQAVVEATFERIQQDPRHGDVSLLEFVRINNRTFDNWAMAYVGGPSDIFASVEEVTGFDQKKILSQQLFMKLQTMVTSSVAA